MSRGILSTRAAQGFNAVQFDVVSTPYVGNHNAHYGTPDGITPFSVARSYVASPNATYFARVDQYVELCARFGLLAILNPYEASTYGNGGGMPDLVNAGKAACLAYGQYLGKRYGGFLNVAWQLGNDCKINNVVQFDVMQAIAQGIRSHAPNQLMVIELEYLYSTALENTGYGTFRGLMNLNGAYTYGPTYGYSLLAYNSTSTVFDGMSGTNTSSPCPSVLLEANYEFENVSRGSQTDGGTPLNLRKQSYWCSCPARLGRYTVMGMCGVSKSTAGLTSTIRLAWVALPDRGKPISTRQAPLTYCDGRTSSPPFPGGNWCRIKRTLSECPATALPNSAGCS